MNVIKESLTVLIGVLATLKDRGLSILKAVFLPLIIVTGLDSISSFLSDQETISGISYYLIIIILELVSLFQYTYVAVCTHRIVILGKDSVPEWGFRSYTSREGIFYFYSLLFTVLSYAVMSASQLTQNNWVVMIPWIFITYILVRFSLIFPAIAVDQYITLKESWRYTQRKFIFMFMATMVWPFLVIIPVVLFVMGVVMIGGSIIPLIGVIAGGIISVFFVIIFISSLSLAYLRIVEKSEDEVQIE